MAGTKAGGLKAAATNKQRYGLDFYRGIGHKGGSISKGGGFSYDHKGEDGLTGHERAVIAGAKGGKVSRRKTNIEIAEAKSEGSRYNEDYQEQKSWFKRVFK